MLNFGGVDEANFCVAQLLVFLRVEHSRFLYPSQVLHLELLYHLLFWGGGVYNLELLKRLKFEFYICGNSFTCLYIMCIYIHTVGGRNPAPLYLHPKTSPRTPSLTLGLCLVVSKKEVESPKSCTTSMTKDTQH